MAVLAALTPISGKRQRAYSPRTESRPRTRLRGSDETGEEAWALERTDGARNSAAAALAPTSTGDHRDDLAPLIRGSMQCLFLFLGSAKRPIFFERYSSAVLAENRVAI